MYGEASGTIWLDDVVCEGSETSITQCKSIGWGVHDCGHSEDVAIICSSGKFSGSLRTQVNTMPQESFENICMDLVIVINFWHRRIILVWAYRIHLS